MVVVEDERFKGDVRKADDISPVKNKNNHFHLIEKDVRWRSMGREIVELLMMYRPMTMMVLLSPLPLPSRDTIIIIRQSYGTW